MCCMVLCLFAGDERCDPSRSAARGMLKKGVNRLNRQLNIHWG